MPMTSNFVLSIADALSRGRWYRAARIVGLLGRGGMGEVYEAEGLHAPSAGRSEIPPSPLSKDGAMLARFHREVRAARHVTHSDVCAYRHSRALLDGRRCILLSMEYIDGEGLTVCSGASAICRMRRASNWRDNFARAWLRPISRHDHRDLKPAKSCSTGAVERASSTLACRSLLRSCAPTKCREHLRTSRRTTSRPTGHHRQSPSTLSASCSMKSSPDTGRSTPATSAI